MIPPEKNVAFVWTMEQVLDLYQRPYDPTEPVICVDEKSKQRISEMRTPLPIEPGMPQQYDSHYKREGTVNIFVAFEPLRDWRGTQVTDHLTYADVTRFVRWLVDEVYPEARVIHLVMGNLNTYTPAAFYEAFPASEAHCLAQRVRFHHTPQTWQLAEHGGNRVERYKHAGSGRPHAG